MSYRRDNIHIVLVEPQGAQNIGSCARAMKNFGLERLVLVNPVDFKNDEAFSMACKAKDVLLKARVVPTVEQALEGMRLVVGTTRREGKLREPLLSIDEALPIIERVAVKNPVAILFGREDRGLENPVLERCNLLFHIPTDEGYPSLNLAQAVMLVCYGLFRLSPASAQTAIVACDSHEVELMFAHMERALRRLGYGGKDRKGEFLLRSVLRNFRKLFGRTSLMKREVNMIRGILTRIERLAQEEE